MRFVLGKDQLREICGYNKFVVLQTGEKPGFSQISTNCEFAFENKKLNVSNVS